MIRVGLNGFGKVGMYFAHLVSQHQDIELVINDITALDEKVEQYAKSGVGGSAVEDNGRLRIDYRDFKYILSRRDTSLSEIPWSVDLIDLIVEAAKVPTVDELKEHLNNAEYVVITGTPREGKLKEVFTYNEGARERFDKDKHKIISFGNDRAQIAGPVLSVLEGLYGVKNAFVAVVREPYSPNNKPRIDTLGDIARFMPQFEGRVFESMVLDTAFDLVKMVLTYNTMGDEPLVINKVKSKFSDLFNSSADTGATIERVAKRWASDRMGFEISYHPFKAYTQLLYNFITRELGANQRS